MKEIEISLGSSLEEEKKELISIGSESLSFDTRDQEEKTFTPFEEDIHTKRLAKVINHSIRWTT